MSGFLAHSLSRRQWLQTAGAGMAAVSLAPRLLVAAEEAPAKQFARVLSEDPFNAEPAPQALVRSWQTPLAHFFVRSHGQVPKLEAGEFRVSVEGMVRRPRQWSVGELREKLRQRSAPAALTCAGNRRQELSEIKPVGGVQWSIGAIGQADWQGATLAELLEAAEVMPGAKHVWFEGADPVKEKDGSVAPFGGSIPLDKALAQHENVPGCLLATHMNGAPLLPAHGFPLRTVVPGYIGARSVKWLKKIVVSDRPSPNHYLAEAYKVVQTDSLAEARAADPIYEFPLNAAICLPAAGKAPAGRTKLAGYALPSGAAGAGIAKVEISIDGGRNWSAAKLDDRQAPFCWRLWEAEVDLPAGKHQLVARAVDERGRSQPEDGKWNFKGYLWNAWSRVAVETA